MDAESAHNLIHRLAPLLAGLPAQSFSAANLQTRIAGVAVSNPVGLAAGFDKNGSLAGVYDRLGFGFAEVGSVCGEPTGGNPKPRVFRLSDDEAVINRLGLNGEGAEAVAARLQKTKFCLPTGLNIAKTNHPDIHGARAVQDVVKTFGCVRSLPLAYIAFNPSCPNTHEGILRETTEFDQILKAVQEANLKQLPIFVKLSPDSNNELLDDLIVMSRAHHVAGFICGNTTQSREDLQTSQRQVGEIGKGGLSGKPLKQRALETCRRVAARKSAEQQIIGCGGIASGQDAYDFLQAGATAVQLYTGLVYHGPGLVAQINRELSELLSRVADRQMQLG